MLLDFYLVQRVLRITIREQDSHLCLDILPVQVIPWRQQLLLLKV